TSGWPQSTPLAPPVNRIRPAPRRPHRRPHHPRRPQILLLPRATGARKSTRLKSLHVPTIFAIAVQPLAAKGQHRSSPALLPLRTPTLPYTTLFRSTSGWPQSTPLAPPVNRIRPAPRRPHRRPHHPRRPQILLLPRAT